jgi:hypothetical protein
MTPRERHDLIFIVGFALIVAIAVAVFVWI